MDLILKGNQGKTLTVGGDIVRIEKKSRFSSDRDKTILIRNITSVEVKKPGAFVGFIQFSIAGGKARDSSFTWSGGSASAVGDENSVVFQGKEKYEIALRMKAFIESWTPKEASSGSSQPVAPVSAADEIRKLKALLDEGLLTKEEFEHKKRQLLGM